MKKYILALAFVFFGKTFLYAQKSSSDQENDPTTVENYLSGLQIGIMSIGGFHEIRLHKNWILKNEIGLRGNLFVYGSDADFYLQPEISVQPRWYYNLKKRNEKGKNTAMNSANFLSVLVPYRSDWFSVFNHDDNHVKESLSAYLLWGLKRSYGKHFHLEFAAGLGYYEELGLESYQENDSGVYPALDFRIGYQF